MSRKCFRVIVICRKSFPMVMPALLLMDETSADLSKFCEEGTQPFPIEIPWQHVHSQPRLSCAHIFSLKTDSLRRSNCFASSSLVSRMSHIAFDLLANILGAIWRLLNLASMSLRLLTSVVSKEIVLVVTTSRVSGRIRNSFPFVYFRYCSYNAASLYFWGTV